MVAKKFQVPTSFTIPADISGVIGLLKARGWERAAIVYAYTKAEGKGRPKNAGKTAFSGTQFPCSYSDFASLGISGLRDRDTVAMYRDRWADAIKKGKAKAVKPGDTITVPDLDWPPTGHAAYPKSDYDDEYAFEAQIAGATTDSAKRVSSNKAAVEAAVAADPEVAKAAVRGLNRRAAKREAELPQTKLTAKQKRLQDKENEATRVEIGQQVDQAFASAEIAGIIAVIEELTDDLKGLVESYSPNGLPEGYIEKIDEALAGFNEELNIARMSASKKS